MACPSIKTLTGQLGLSAGLIVNGTFRVGSWGDIVERYER